MDNPKANMLFLVVDDQFNVRRMVQNFLKTFGYTQSVDASDGSRAWEVISVKNVDFIICDWNMPNTNGLEFLRMVRGDERFERTPFLMVTAEVVEEVVAEAIEEGVDGYIVKPFKAHTLIDHIESILERYNNPGVVEKALLKAEEMLKAGRYLEVVKICDEVLLKQPKSPRTHHLRGKALEGSGKLEEAENSFKRSVELAVNYVKGHEGIARMRKAAGDIHTAASHLKKAAAISPRNPRRQLNLGRTLLEAGDAEGGAKALRAAQRNAGKDAALQEMIGEQMLSAGLYEDASSAFNDALAINPRLVHLYNRLGISYRRQGMPAMAVIEYEKALKAKPEDENLHYNMAVALYEAKKPGQAVRHLKQAISIAPNFVEAAKMLSALEKKA